METGHVRPSSSRSEDEESHEICIKPSWTIGEVKRWMCIRLPCLRHVAPTCFRAWNHIFRGFQGVLDHLWAVSG